jgi:hypothetical protein
MTLIQRFQDSHPAVYIGTDLADAVVQALEQGAEATRTLEAMEKLAVKIRQRIDEWPDQSEAWRANVGVLLLQDVLALLAPRPAEKATP